MFSLSRRRSVEMAAVAAATSERAAPPPPPPPDATESSAAAPSPPSPSAPPPPTTFLCANLIFGPWLPFSQTLSEASRARSAFLRFRSSSRMRNTSSSDGSAKGLRSFSSSASAAAASAAAMRRASAAMVGRWKREEEELGAPSVSVLQRAARMIFRVLAHSSLEVRGSSCRRRRGAPCGTVARRPARPIPAGRLRARRSPAAGHPARSITP